MFKIDRLHCLCRVKSLSKGNNPKKDLSASTLNLRESTAVPLSSGLPTVSTLDSFDVANGTNRFGWSKHIEKEVSLPFSMDCVPSGREEVHVAFSYNNYYREQGRSFTTSEEEDFVEEDYEQEKRSRRKGKADTYSASGYEDKSRRVDNQTKWKDVPDTDANSLRSDDDLNALLKVRSHVAFFSIQLMTDV